METLKKALEDIIDEVKSQGKDLRSASLTIEIHFSPVGEVDIHYSLRQRKKIL